MLSFCATGHGKGYRALMLVIGFALRESAPGVTVLLAAPAR